jgi:hypothetical protein
MLFFKQQCTGKLLFKIRERVTNDLRSHRIFIMNVYNGISLRINDEPFNLFGNNEKKYIPQIRSRYSTQSSSDERALVLDDFWRKLNAEPNAPGEKRKIAREQVENEDWKFDVKTKFALTNNNNKKVWSNLLWSFWVGNTCPGPGDHGICY